MPLDIDKLYKDYLEKPFFAQDIRGSIYFCDFMKRNINAKGDYWLVDSYDVYGRCAKFTMNSDYLDLYTKPLIISNSRHNNMLLLADESGNILLTTKEDFKDGAYTALYYVDIVDSKEYKVGDTDYYTFCPNGKSGFEILPPAFKIRVDFNHT
jgi:hypothetical protein